MADHYLSKRHRKMLEVESGITSEIIRARGYRTVTAAEARKFGFTGHQARDGLLLPVHTTDGQPGPYVLRPDDPRVIDLKQKPKDSVTGDRPQKVIKYEWPRGMDSRIDCPLLCYPQLKDPTIPLWITEGQKKGDALASWSLCVIDLPNGVWGWKSKSTGILADLDYIVWVERTVYVVFDADVITKPSVAQALARLTKILVRRGAKVIPVPLPQTEETKLGVDDFKAQGGTLEQLQSFAALGALLPLKTDARRGIEAESVEYLKALSDMGYDFRMRAIDDVIEVNQVPITDPVRAQIRTRMRDAGFKNAAIIEDAYTAWAYDHMYHPIQDYLNQLEWDGMPHIATLASYFRDDHARVYRDVMQTTEEYPGSAVFYLWLTRWLIGAVAKVLAWSQNVMLVLDGAQGCGKSYFVQWLGGVLPDYFIAAPVNPEDKDTWVRLLSKFVWEVAELGATARRSDREALKNFITTSTVHVRKSYGKYDTIKPATASLIGTINNEAGFLTDPTGNRRFLICRLTRVNWAYTALDPHQVWAEAVAMYKQQPDAYRLSPDEVKLRAAINDEYMIQIPAVQMLLKHYGIDPALDTWTPAMDIVTRLEAMGLKGNQYQHLKDLANFMKTQGVHKGRPRIGEARPVAYKGVYEKTSNKK